MEKIGGNVGETLKFGEKCKFWSKIEMWSKILIHNRNKYKKQN